MYSQFWGYWTDPACIYEWKGVISVAEYRLFVKTAMIINCLNQFCFLANLQLSDELFLSIQTNIEE